MMQNIILASFAGSAFADGEAIVPAGSAVPQDMEMVKFTEGMEQAMVSMAPMLQQMWGELAANPPQSEAEIEAMSASMQAMNAAMMTKMGVPQKEIEAMQKATKEMQGKIESVLGDSEVQTIMTEAMASGDNPEKMQETLGDLTCCIGEKAGMSPEQIQESLKQVTHMYNTMESMMKDMMDDTIKGNEFGIDEDAEPVITE